MKLLPGKTKRRKERFRRVTGIPVKEELPAGCIPTGSFQKIF